jgi:hypothetical protein
MINASGGSHTLSLFQKLFRLCFTEGFLPPILSTLDFISIEREMEDKSV